MHLKYIIINFLFILFYIKSIIEQNSFWDLCFNIVIILWWLSLIIYNADMEMKANNFKRRLKTRLRTLSRENKELKRNEIMAGQMCNAIIKNLKNKYEQKT